MTSWTTATTSSVFSSSCARPYVNSHPSRNENTTNQPSPTEVEEEIQCKLVEHYPVTHAYSSFSSSTGEPTGQHMIIVTLWSLTHSGLGPYNHHGTRRPEAAVDPQESFISRSGAPSDCAIQYTTQRHATVLSHAAGRETVPRVTARGREESVHYSSTDRPLYEDDDKLCGYTSPAVINKLSVQLHILRSVTLPPKRGRG